VKKNKKAFAAEFERERCIGGVRSSELSAVAGLFAPFIFQGKQDDTAFLGEGCRMRFYWRWPLTRAPVVIWVQLA
jgi:hypothetical protein